MWDVEVACANCGVPFSSLGKQSSGVHRSRGNLCLTCYKYQNRYGRPRPQYLWGIGPLGWCECGFPAIALVESMPVCVRHKE